MTFWIKLKGTVCRIFPKNKTDGLLLMCGGDLIQTLFDFKCVSAITPSFMASSLYLGGNSKYSKEHIKCPSGGEFSVNSS